MRFSLLYWQSFCNGKTFSLIPQSGNFILESLSKTFCAATQSFLWGMPQCAIVVLVVVVPTKLTSKYGRKEWGSLWGSWQQSRLSGLQVPEANRGRCVERCAAEGDLEGAQVQQPGLNKADPAHCSRRQVQRHPAY